MRRLACILVAISTLAVSTTDALAVDNTPLRLRTQTSALSRFTGPFLHAAAMRRLRATRPSGRTRPAARLSALETGIVAGINAQRGTRGLRPLRISRGLTVAAQYHSRQMGTFGFFEHESRNGAPFWRRLERFYPARPRRAWLVGENLFWESPETSATSTVHEWMMSPPHRANVLSRDWHEVGIAAVHFNSAPGEYGGRPVTIVTADFGARS